MTGKDLDTELKWQAFCNVNDPDVKEFLARVGDQVFNEYAGLYGPGGNYHDSLAIGRRKAQGE